MHHSDSNLQPKMTTTTASSQGQIMMCSWASSCLRRRRRWQLSAAWSIHSIPVLDSTPSCSWQNFWHSKKCPFRNIAVELKCPAASGGCFIKLPHHFASCYYVTKGLKVWEFVFDDFWRGRVDDDVTLIGSSIKSSHKSSRLDMQIGRVFNRK